jgi:hypothetical protein
LEKTETVTVSPENPRLVFDLPRFGLLSVSPDLGVPIRDAQVTLDGRPLGSLPLSNRKVAVGPHRLQVTWPDGSTFAAQVDINDVSPTVVVVRPQ